MAVWGALIGAAINYAMRPKGQDTPSSMADPWAAQRPQYMAQLNQLMQRGIDPGDPAYKARMEAGTSAIERSAAARGTLGSGSTLTELNQFGQGLAAQEYQAQFDRLSQLAGVNAGSPIAAAQLAAGQQKSAAQGAGILGTEVFQALKGLYGTSSDTTYTQQNTGFNPNTGYDTGTGMTMDTNLGGF